MNHKRRGPKSTRAGSMYVKPHKHQGSRHETTSLPIAEQAARIGEREQRERYTGIPCDEGWCPSCARCSPWPDDVCSTPGCPDCGGTAEAAHAAEPLRVPIAERLAA